MARVKKSRRTRGEWVSSITRPQSHKRKASGRHDPLERALRGVAELPERRAQERGRKLVLWLDEFGPELLRQHLAVGLLAQVDWPCAPRDRIALRPVRSTRELVDHLLARFPLPPVLHQVFRGVWLPQDARLDLARTAALLGGGGSWKDARRRGWLPPSATRRIVQAFLAAPEGIGPGAAWRRAQAVGQGLPAWVGTALVAHHHPRSLWEADEGWREDICWLGKHCRDEAELARVAQFLRLHPQRLAGRPRTEVMALVEAWDEHRHRPGPPAEDAPAWKSSGLDPRLQAAGWELLELVRPWELWHEGQAMRHCVWSYRARAASGAVSIWSLRYQGERRVTVELRNRDRRLLQVRGVLNRPARAEEWTVLRAWTEGLRSAPSSSEA